MVIMLTTDVQVFKCRVLKHECIQLLDNRYYICTFVKYRTAAAFKYSEGQCLQLWQPDNSIEAPLQKLTIIHGHRQCDKLRVWMQMIILKISSRETSQVWDDGAMHALYPLCA
ncbi:hypothetical protein ABBQ32_002950 [Trebouxia sp. C0010 RCD-2024]